MKEYKYLVTIKEGNDHFWDHVATLPAQQQLECIRLEIIEALVDNVCLEEYLTVTEVTTPYQMELWLQTGEFS